jgi:UDP-glucose 4-epimerase
MTILVTGGAGFIGSNLVDRLILEGEDVIVMDNFSTGHRSNLNKKAKWTDTDICDKERVDSLFEAYEFDTIYHLAAMSRVEPSLSRPELAFETNVLGTKNILDAAEECNARVIYAGSSTVEAKYKTPYGFTKYLGEELCKFYNRQKRVRTVITRFGNVYGLRQHEEGEYSTVIGIFERQLRNGEVLTVTGSGKQKRDFVHVYDIVSGLLLVKEAFLSHLSDYVVEFGSGKNHTIENIAVMFAGPHYSFIPARGGEMEETLVNIEKANSWLDWEPTIELEDYIAKIKDELRNENTI